MRVVRGCYECLNLRRLSHGKCDEQQGQSDVTYAYMVLLRKSLN